MSADIKPSYLFVDEDPLQLSALRRLLRDLPGTKRSATSGEAPIWWPTSGHCAARPRISRARRKTPAHHGRPGTRRRTDMSDGDAAARRDF